MLTSDDRMAGDRVVISVCVSCLPLGGEASDERPGRVLLDALRARVGDTMLVKPVQCLSVCKRPCTIALSKAGGYTYVFGDIDQANGVDDILNCATFYAQDPHGYMLWRERPESLRRGIVARIPPPGWDAEDGSHPR